MLLGLLADPVQGKREGGLVIAVQFHSPGSWAL